MNRKSSITIIAMFIVFVVTINVLNLVTEDKHFSEAENRILAKQPSLTWKSIKNGRFTQRFEDYVTDQFIFRDFWVGLKSDSERLLLKQDNNDVFFGKDDYLLENFNKPKEEIIDRNIANINYYASKLKDMKTYVLLPPTSIKVNENRLPPFATPYDELLTINKMKNNLLNVDFVDVYQSLKDKNDQYLYFRTDHHWTMRGAYYAYEVLGKEMGIKPIPMNEFDAKIVTEEFYGTLYSKANNYHIKPDYIEVFTPAHKTNVQVDYVSENKSSNSLYEEKHLDTKDKYSYFLDGNHPIVTIKSDVSNGRKLMIFKNSYAHCLIPFLVNHYEEIHILDLRFYKMNVYDYISENNITETLFLYDILNFSKDTSLNILNIK
ncbi:DHHW family protein [Vallitalea guaymasensis]|uniref:DHHW family protein n=1 Tax=Vallitalea guaymasensis TaxID=1185412 RepID=UPI00272AFAAF|nr:DHHW family protein [Vallitalea guaymasensis]